MNISNWFFCHSLFPLRTPKPFALFSATSQPVSGLRYPPRHWSSCTTDEYIGLSEEMRPYNKILRRSQEFEGNISLGCYIFSAVCSEDFSIVFNVFHRSIDFPFYRKNMSNFWAFSSFKPFPQSPDKYSLHEIKSVFVRISLCILYSSRKVAHLHNRIILLIRVVQTNIVSFSSIVCFHFILPRFHTWIHVVPEPVNTMRTPSNIDQPPRASRFQFFSSSIRLRVRKTGNAHRSQGIEQS